MQGKSLSATLEPSLAGIEPRHRSLAQELTFGTLRWFFQLDAIAGALLHQPQRKLEPEIRGLLLVGLYQLRFGKTASHLVVSESVDAARAMGHPHLAKVVNAVLRGYQRRESEFADALLSESARTAHPQWMIDRIRKDWPDQWLQILAANNTRAPMSLRLDLSKTNREAYLRLLRDHGISAEPCKQNQQGLQLDRPVDVACLPGFDAGWVSVQDEAAQLAAWLLGPKAGDRILDACAAPGGKTGHLLETPDVEVVALDSSEPRLKKVQDNLERLGKSATLIAGDARETESWWDGKAFDCILLDAPCSATGVIRRHPDIRLLRRPSDIARLAKLQREILEAVWPTLGSKGRLLYATCSLMRKENESVVQGFLEDHPEASPQAIEMDAGIACRVGRQLLPTEGGNDGFYYALLTREPSGSRD